LGVLLSFIICKDWLFYLCTLRKVQKLPPTLIFLTRLK
jgi:hypothetical protein